MQRLLSKFKEAWAGLFGWPLLVSLLSGGLACLVSSVRGWPNWAASWFGSSDSVQSALSSIASAIMSTAGITFSVVILTLTLISNQFTPRALRNFIEDRTSRVTLSVLVGNFVYNEILLMSLKEDPSQMPLLGLIGAVTYLCLSTVVFVYFIHHTADQIQISSLIHSIVDDTLLVIRRLLEEQQPPSPERSWVGPRQEAEGHPVTAREIGYVESVNLEKLCDLAASLEGKFILQVAAGDYTSGQTVLLTSTRPVSSNLVGDIRFAFRTSDRRTVNEDPAFGFRELVDIAIGATSPAINDPTTACDCVDGLTALLIELSRADWPSPEIVDSEGTVRIVMPPSHFEDYLELASGQLRVYGNRDLHVLLRLADMFFQVKRKNADNKTVMEGVYRQVRLLAEAADRGLQISRDRARFGQALEKLGVEYPGLTDPCA